MKKRFCCILGITLVLSLSVGLAHSATDIVLKIEGLDGESKIKGHEGEIDVLSWDWNVTQSGSMHVGGGGGSGKAQVQDIAIVKYIDKSSINLFRNCFNGAHLGEATLTFIGAGENQIEYLKITMTPVLITSVGIGGENGEDRHTEIVTLNFAKVKISYTPQKEDGSADAAIEITWNIEKNIEE